ncbi:MAG: DUF192 domain-containing protein [Solirubrobacteraceae bacterium]
MLPRRLRRLPEWAGVRVATGPRARLLGLAFLRRPPPGTGLLLPRTRSVHTFGMRFALDLHWLDAQGRVIRLDRAVPPRRLRTCPRARAVIEVVSEAGSPASLRAS